jgi:predicted small lipoprotein YifL
MHFLPTGARRLAVYPLLCLSALLQACGQSGDLYLPEPAEPVRQEAQAQSSGAANDAPEKESQESGD